MSRRDLLKIPATIRIKALGLEFECEFEIPRDALAVTTPESPSMLTDADLRDRWRCSSRSIYRLRRRGDLPYINPTPKKFLYRLADVERLEAESSAPSIRSVPKRAAGRSS